MIVPKQWVKDIKLHKEKFYNNSLNHSQIFTCYYTNDRNAFDDDGYPKLDYAANFQVGFRNNFNDEGLFRIKLKQYKSSKESAIQYVASHRNIAPGLYNEQRLQEEPIPDGNHEELIPNDDVIGNEETVRDDDGENELERSGPADPVEEIIIVNSTNTAAVAEQMSSDDQNQSHSNNSESVFDADGRSNHQIVTT